jgi:hypothetical protein
MRSRLPVRAQGTGARSGTLVWIPVARRVASMSPVLQGSALRRALIQPPRKSGASGCAEPRQSFRRSRCRFVRKGLAPKVARVACCCVKRHGVPLNTTLRRSNSTGAGTPDPIRRKPPPVHAQGIGVRSGTRCWIPVARRAASMSSVLQGSALWRALPADTKIRVRGATAIRSCCRFVRKGLVPDQARVVGFRWHGVPPR